MKTISIERRKKSLRVEAHRALRPSHYLIEPLLYGPGWRLRFVGQYADNGQFIELGGGVFGAADKEDELEAYRAARRRGENWVGTHHFVAEERKFKGFPRRIEQAVDEELRHIEGIRSEEYRLGMLDFLSAQAEGTWSPYRFPDGTAERDAYYAGKEHARRRWIELQVQNPVPLSPLERLEKLKQPHAKRKGK